MRLSKLFTKTRKEIPADEVAKNARLLIQAGYIYKEMAGVYALLPLGLRVVEKIKSIIREEMNNLGCQELLMTSLQRKELWERTDRWDDKEVDVWFKSKLKNNKEVGFGWSHEEPISEMMRGYLKSYKDLPANVYQFQTKLRNETRAKSGIMRGREFVMKDLYSYSVSEAEHDKFYNSVIDAYLRVFKNVGLGKKTFLTFASGGAFTEFSHEFQTLTEAGEDTIYLDRSKKIAINEEVLRDDVLKKVGLKRSDLEKVRASEVGNIFSFGSVKSEQLNLYFSDKKGQKKPVILGSYGIGVTRLMGVIVECFADDGGIVWPKSVAPAQVHIAALHGGEKESENLYVELQNNNVETIIDDREISPGEKLNDADMLGIPMRVVVSSKSLENGGFEIKKRTEKETKIVNKKELLQMLGNSN
ncbi:prolyl-tRNA synthetase [Candidatus Saccharibacteria bacterium CPR2]|nr:prolyl-tRNA synthetase [Candidatus Saccharibacteria bacterium CPR2]